MFFLTYHTTSPRNSTFPFDGDSQFYNATQNKTQTSDVKCRVHFTSAILHINIYFISHKNSRNTSIKNVILPVVKFHGYTTNDRLPFLKNTYGLYFYIRYSHHCTRVCGSYTYPQFLSRVILFQQYFFKRHTLHGIRAQRVTYAFFYYTQEELPLISSCFPRITPRI